MKKTNEYYQKKKLAFFMATFLEHGGGLEKYLINTARELNKLGDIECTIITLDDNYSVTIGRIVNFIKRKVFDNSMMYRETYEKILEQLGTTKYIKCKSLGELKNTLLNQDIIYSKNEVLEAAILKYLVGYDKIPIIYGVHTPHKYIVANEMTAKIHNLIYCSSIYNFFVKGCRMFHVSNAQSKIDLEKQFNDIEVSLIYYPYSTEKQKASNSAHELSKDIYSGNQLFENKPDIKNIFWAGRLTQQKGVDDLVAIVETVNKSQAHKVVWHIAGEGEERNLIDSLVKSHVNVKYYGHIPNEKLLQILRKMDLLISTSHWEVSPYNILEAQSLDVPVIAFNIPGPSDIIDNYHSGWLVDNIKEFEEVLTEFVNGKIKNTMPPSETINAKFNKDIIYKKLNSLFLKII